MDISVGICPLSTKSILFNLTQASTCSGSSSGFCAYRVKNYFYVISVYKLNRYTSFIKPKHQLIFYFSRREKYNNKKPELLDQDLVWQAVRDLWMHQAPFLLCSWSDECQDQSQNNLSPAIKQWTGKYSSFWGSRTAKRLLNWL